MGKQLVNGNWILTREAETPDSDRRVERDDVFFPELQKLFQGLSTKVDFAAISSAKKLHPEDVFCDLHANYGYICIGTGENPAINEKLTDEQRLQRRKEIERLLEQEKLPHVLIRGKYMGVEEDSYFIPFCDNQYGLAGILQSEVIRKVERIAELHHQDSLLITQNGYACYLYTTGSQKGNIVAGRTAVVYPEQAQLPDDCFTQFMTPDDKLSIAFTCALNFNRVYSSAAEFAAEENKTLQKHFEDFIREWQNIADHTEHKKVVVLLRGTDGYNTYAKNLKAELQRAGINAAIFGSEANAAVLNAEGWTHWPSIRKEFLRRNAKIYDALIKRDVDVIVYADMNKLFEFMLPYIQKAQANGYRVISHVVNSFVFEPGRSDFMVQLCNQYGDFMARHVADFRSEKSLIHAEKLDGNVAQYHSLPIDALAKEIVAQVAGFNQKPEQDDVKSAAAIVGGLVPTLLAAPKTGLDKAAPAGELRPIC